MPEADEDLVRRAIAGEPTALERLLLAHHAGLVGRIARKIPASARATVTAEDVLQEAYADAFRTIGQFRPPEGRPGAFSGWLTTIAENRLADALRGQRAAKRGGGRAPARFDGSSIADLVQLVAVNHHTPSRSARGHELAASVQIALAGLRAEYREVVSLRFLQGLPVAEVAGRMGKTESAVHKLCSRALQAIREAVGEQEPFLSRS